MDKDLTVLSDQTDWTQPIVLFYKPSGRFFLLALPLPIMDHFTRLSDNKHRYLMKY